MTLDTVNATTGTVRASCAIWRETVRISANCCGTFPQVRAHFRWSQRFLRYVRNVGATGSNPVTSTTQNPFDGADHATDERRIGAR